MFFTSKRLMLRLFTLALMATTIGINYPGTSASAGTVEQCVSQCGSYHSNIQECYQQSLCKKNCRVAECDRVYYNSIIPCIPNGPGPIDPMCSFHATPIRDECLASANSHHSTRIFSCDRLYWEHCPDPE